jgi:hypothetical protein
MTMQGHSLLFWMTVLSLFGLPVLIITVTCYEIVKRTAIKHLYPRYRLLCRPRIN